MNHEMVSSLSLEPSFFYVRQVSTILLQKVCLIWSNIAFSALVLQKAKDVKLSEQSVLSNLYASFFATYALKKGVSKVW